MGNSRMYKNGYMGVSEPVVASLQSLRGELEQVEQEVRKALDGLQAPFSHLVQNQLAAGLPLLRAAFVLTAGVGVVDGPALAQRRLYLGAAIEVLRLALAVHTRLLAGAQAQGQLDRSLLGSTVLAGDFCFSRAAGLAARTDSPVVVDIFAQALQRVSEGTLRGLFGGSEGTFDVDRELCLSGVLAGSELAGLSDHESRADQQAAARLLAWRAAGAAGNAEPPPASLAILSPARAQRWEALAAWLQGG